MLVYRTRTYKLVAVESERSHTHTHRSPLGITQDVTVDFKLSLPLILKFNFNQMKLNLIRLHGMMMMIRCMLHGIRIEFQWFALEIFFG